MPTLVATPWPRGPVVVSMPEVQRPRALAVELAETLDVIERDRQLAEPLVVRIARAPLPGGVRAGSALDEGEKVGVDHVGVRRAQTMWKVFVDLQGALPEELRGEQR